MIEYDDPELGDEEDPEYREEMFLTYQQMGTRPEELMDAEMREEYRQWLERQRKRTGTD